MAGVLPARADSGTCGDNLRWNYDSSTGTLTISGTGEMDDYTYPHVSNNQPPWWSFPLTTVVVEEGVTHIGNCAFAEQDELVSVSLPARLRCLGEQAFTNCTSLTSITLPQGLEVIDTHAFASTALESVTLPEGLHTIGEYAFFFCEDLQTLTLPESMDSIGRVAFGSCHTLATATLPQKLRAMGEAAFMGCYELHTFTWPENMKRIPKDAFMYCGFKELTIPEGVTEIGDRAFADCNELASILLPQSITSIGKETFYSCELLPSITLPANVDSIGEAAFGGCTALQTVTSLPLTPPAIDERAFDAVTITVYVPAEAYEAYLSTPYWQDMDLQRMAGSGVHTVLAGNVMVQGGEVVLHIAPEDLPEVNVYDTSGRCVLRTREARFALPHPGVYVLRAGRESVKVML